MGDWKTPKRPRSKLEPVLAFHPTIRYAVLIGEDATPEETVKRETVKSLEPQEETRKILQRFAIAKGMSTDSDPFFGKMLTIIVRREKLVELLFPMASGMILVSAEPTFPLEKIPQLDGLVSSLGRRPRS